MRIYFVWTIQLLPSCNIHWENNGQKSGINVNDNIWDIRSKAIKIGQTKVKQKKADLKLRLSKTLFCGFVFIFILCNKHKRKKKPLLVSKWIKYKVLTLLNYSVIYILIQYQWVIKIATDYTLHHYHQQFVKMKWIWKSGPPENTFRKYNFCIKSLHLKLQATEWSA